jgi:phosphonate transport system substrate-binding protein
MQYSRLLVFTLILGSLLMAPPAPAKGKALCGPGEHLTLGVFPRRNPAMTDTMFSPLAKALGEALGCQVVLRTASDFAHFWHGVKSQSYDIVHYNQYHYIESAAAYQVIAHNEEFGSGTLAGAIYARRDSGISNLSQLAGK